MVSKPFLNFSITGVVGAQIAGIQVRGSLHERGHDEEEEESVVIAHPLWLEHREIDFFEPPR
jgi:hypothetical protein